MERAQTSPCASRRYPVTRTKHVEVDILASVQEVIISWGVSQPAMKSLEESEHWEGAVVSHLKHNAQTRMPATII